MFVKKVKEENEKKTEVNEETKLKEETEVKEETEAKEETKGKVEEESKAEMEERIGAMTEKLRAATAAIKQLKLRLDRQLAPQLPPPCRHQAARRCWYGAAGIGCIEETKVKEEIEVKEEPR